MMCSASSSRRSEGAAGLHRRRKQDIGVHGAGRQSRYHYFKVTYKFVPGATAGTTDATWTGTYIPIGDMGPPEHIKQVSIKVIKAFLNAAKDNQLAQNRLLVTQADAGAERSA